MPLRAAGAADATAAPGNRALRLSARGRAPTRPPARARCGRSLSGNPRRHPRYAPS